MSYISLIGGKSLRPDPSNLGRDLVHKQIFGMNSQASRTQRADDDMYAQYASRTLTQYAGKGSVANVWA